jgi:16S rRNA C967 or C1407 C5-methylase (RsmB/RsmF family)
MECDMLSKEFAQEVAKEVFNMLEEKWAEKRNERAAAKAIEAERRAKERANRLPATARKMLEALQRAEVMAGGPVGEWIWREQVRLETDGMTHTNVRTAFSRYRNMMLTSGKIRCENGKYAAVLASPDDFDAPMLR